MSDLTPVAGFPLWLDGERLRFGEGVSMEETRPRSRGELASVAFEPAACVPPEAIQYWMYNGIARQEDRSALSSRPVRYELTCMSPQPLGRERAKTFGHIHTAPSPGAPTFAEIFEVLHGTAHFLFYTLDLEKGAAPFCRWVEARAGEKIMGPSNLFHLVVNGGESTLVFADVISRRAFGIYDPVRATRGAPYFEMTDGHWQRNPIFQHVAPLSYAGIRLRQDLRPLYTQFAEDPDALVWLDKPEIFPEQFELYPNA